jgi:hypothetical protein
MSGLKKINLKACLDVLDKFLEDVESKNVPGLSHEIERAKKALEHLEMLVGTMKILQDHLKKACKEAKTISVAGCAGKKPAVRECLG